MAVKMAVESMKMPSGGNSPSRRRAGTETSVPRNGVSRWRRCPWSLSGVSSIIVGFSRHERLYRRRGGARRRLGVPHTRGRPPLAAPPCGVGPSWLPSGPSSVFWKLRGKIRFWALISSNSENISLLGFLKPKTAENSNWHFGILLIG